MKGTVLIAALVAGLLVALLALLSDGQPPTRPVSPVVSEAAIATSSTAPRRAQSAAVRVNRLVADAQTSSPTYTSLYARLGRNGEVPRVRREQLDSYLTKHHRSVGALLGALRASGDDALLKEAMERFPDDPRVQFAAAYKADSAGERQQWLEKFKRSDPENSLANYLLAGEHLQAGRIEAALQELAAAGGKAGFDNHLREFVQDAEEAYHAAGFSEAEAKGTACWTALLPELTRLKQVSIDLVDLAKRYDQAGDTAAAQAVREMGMNLGRRLDQPGQTTLIQALVGSAIERIILNSMDPNAPYGDSGLTPKGAADAIAARRKSLRELADRTEPILLNLPDSELAHFYDRLKMYGEVAALRWVVNQAPTP